MSAIRLCCPADAIGDPDLAANHGDVPLPMPIGDPSDVPGIMKTDLGLEQGDKADLEGLLIPESSPVKVAVVPDEPAASEVLIDFVKVMEGGATEHDAAIDADTDESLLLIDTDSESEGALDVKVYANQNPLSSDHLSLHLPKCRACSVRDGKATKSFSRRRKQLKAIVVAADAIARPFGAVAHLDHIATESKSEAAKAARYCRNKHDEQTSFCIAYPSNNRETDSIMDASHSFDDDDAPVVRRWWADAAPQFAKAAQTIRTQRPLAHYKSAPYGPQANGRAENFNRVLVEGTRCSVLKSELGERRWPLAIVLF